MSYLEELLPEFRKGYILGEIKGNKFHFVTPDGRVLSFAKDKPVWRKPNFFKLTRINAALYESEEHSNMLKNADNFNTSGGNVKENNR